MAVFCPAFFGVWTTNTFLPVFLCLTEIKDSAADDQDDNEKYKEISHVLSLQSIFALNFLVRSEHQGSNNAHHDNNGNQTGEESCAQGLFGDQSTNLVDQECQNVSRRQLKGLSRRTSIFYP